MNWKASPPAIEIAAVTIACCGFGGAVAFAVARVAPLGAGLVEACGAGTFVVVLAGLLMGEVDRPCGPGRPVLRDTFNDPLAGDDSLLLDQRIDDEVLLLDDPLPVLGAESRVVQLFTGNPVDPATAPPALAGPGDMIARIENFLGQARGSATAAAPERRAEQAASDDASAALHAALADIRRSLRHG